MPSRSDQWAYLAGVQRLDADRALTIADAAERAGGILGLPQWSDNQGARPLLRPLLFKQSAPVAVSARLHSRLEIAHAGLPTELRDRLRRTAAFANPA